MEKDITSKILKYLKSQEYCFCFKEHGGRFGTAGIPDIICCYNGRFIAFEVKTEKGKTTELQKSVIRKINAACGLAAVVRSVEDVKLIIDEIERDVGD